VVLTLQPPGGVLPRDARFRGGPLDPVLDRTGEQDVDRVRAVGEQQRPVATDHHPSDVCTSLDLAIVLLDQGLPVALDRALGDDAGPERRSHERDHPRQEGRLLRMDVVRAALEGLGAEGRREVRQAELPGNGASDLLGARPVRPVDRDHRRGRGTG
jgi:hypothetical protein